VRGGILLCKRGGRGKWRRVEADRELSGEGAVPGGVLLPRGDGSSTGVSAGHLQWRDEEQKHVKLHAVHGRVLLSSREHVNGRCVCMWCWVLLSCWLSLRLPWVEVPCRCHLWRWGLYPGVYCGGVSGGLPQSLFALQGRNVRSPWEPILCPLSCWYLWAGCRVEHECLQRELYRCPWVPLSCWEPFRWGEHLPSWYLPLRLQLHCKLHFLCVGPTR